MLHAQPPAEMLPERRLPAWVFSILIHSSAVITLGLMGQGTPRGAAEGPGRSAGIVLKTASAAGDLHESEEDRAQDAITAVVSAPDLLSVAPGDTSVPTEAGTAAPQVPAPDAGAAPGSGQPDTGQMTSGEGQRGSPGGGDSARVTVFGVAGTGTKFVYLFDRSSSMEGAPLAAAKRQLLESLQSLDSIHQFQIIFFNTSTQSFDIAGGRRRIAFATSRNKQLAANFVGGVTASGGTDRLTALHDALAFAPDVIFFLTDSDDPMSPSELKKVDEAAQRAQTMICVIEFGRDQSPTPGNFLTALARQSGGQYGYVNTMTLAR